MKYTSIYIDDLTRVQQSVCYVENLKQCKILVTGATGLICSAIVDFLINLNDTRNTGITVYVAARDMNKAEMRFGAHMKRSDVVFVEYEAMKAIEWDFDVDYIIHGASPANPALYSAQPVETMLINITGMNSILQYAKSHNIRRVLFISSSEVYGKKNSSDPYGDTEYGYVDILNPRACYPSAKRACETLCASYLSEYGVDSVIVRPGHIYGPTATKDDTRASSVFFYDVINGHDIIMKSKGEQIRSYVYVADCVSAVFTVLLKGVTGEAYNLSNSDSVVTIRRLAQEIADCSGKKVVFENPSDAEQRGYNMMDNSSLDASKLSLLGWRGLYSIKDGVEHTLKIMLEEK